MIVLGIIFDSKLLHKLIVLQFHKAYENFRKKTCKKEKYLIFVRYIISIKCVFCLLKKVNF